MPIYLDNNATTALDPEVKKAMEIDLGPIPYNPSAIHSYGRKAKSLLRDARQKTASILGATPSQVTFTSSGTEALNWAIKSLSTSHIITTHLEHPAVYNTIKTLPSEITYLPVNETGAPSPHQIEQALKPNSTIILSAVSGETGAMINLEAIAHLAASTNTTLIIDGVALLGKGPFTFYSGITVIAFSAHKFHGPKGTGILLSRKTLPPHLHGGGQEANLRSGTENLAGILGTARALELIHPSHFSHMQTLRDTFESLLPDAEINGTGPRISNVSNLYFPNIDGETLIIKLDLANIYASQGSACSSGALEPSRPLTAMGYPKERVLNSLRFSLSRHTTLEEIHTATTLIKRALPLPSPM